MYKTRHFYPAELAMFVYLILTGILIVLHLSLLPNAGAQLTFRIGAIVIIIALAQLQNKGMVPGIIKFLRYALPLILLSYLYSETEPLNNFIFKENLDPLFSNIEGSLFGLQPALIFAELLPSNIFAEIMYFGYFSYYLLLVVVPLYIYFNNDPKTSHRSMFIIIHSFLIFYLIFIIFPVAGPQFYFTDWPQLPNAYFFGQVMRFIQEKGEAPTAAFPSSHVSICIMLVFMSILYAKRLILFILPVAVLLVFSTVYIRAHYLIDIFAAFLITPPLYIFSAFIYDWITRTIKPGLT